MKPKPPSLPFPVPFPPLFPILSPFPFLFLFLFLFLSLFLSLFFPCISNAQPYTENTKRIVFANEAIISSSTYRHAKAIYTLNAGKEVMECAKANIPDTIDGIISYWQPVFFRGYKGYVWAYYLADMVFIHENGNRLLVKHQAKGLSYKVFKGDSMINAGVYPEIPYQEYSHVYEVFPIYAQRENCYFKISDSRNIYSFNGTQVNIAGECDSDHINSIHLALQEKVADSTGGFIIGNLTNIRETPQTHAKVIARLPKFTLVKVMGKLDKHEKIGSGYNYWYKIRWQGKTGYVWGENIAVPKIHIYDNDDKNTSYLLCSFGLFVLNQGRMVGSYIFPSEMNDETLHSFGDLGFGKGYDFIGVESMAHACGEWGGDRYFLWDGKQLKYFGASGGVGDGALSSGEELVFPSQHDGLSGKILSHSYSNEMLQCIPLECEEADFSAIEQNSTSVMEYNGDTLVEAPSEHLDIKQLVKHEFPAYRLTQYEFTDLNGDGAKEVVFQVSRLVTEKNENDMEANSFQTTLGIAKRNVEGKLELMVVNDQLIGKEDDYRIKLTCKDSLITIVTYYQINNNESAFNETYGRKIYELKYYAAAEKLLWRSVTMIDEKGMNKWLFRRKKIAFEQIWNFNPDDNSGMNEDR